LRIKAMSGHPGDDVVLRRPNGRATFEIVDGDGEPAIRWRRIGGHDIFHKP